VVVVLVGVYKYSTVWHSDSATECFSVGDQWNDGSLGVCKSSTEIHEAHQYLLDWLLLHFTTHRCTQHVAAYLPAISGLLV